MRNQQIKKVNRIFFSGQDEEKQRWIEQMAAEGWQLISETAFVFSFQRIVSEMAENQPAYKVMLEKDLQESMPLFQDSLPERILHSGESEFNGNNMQFPLVPVSRSPRTDVSLKTRRLIFGTLAVLIFLFISMTNIAIISSGNIVTLFRWQFFTGILFIGISLIMGPFFILGNLLKSVSVECKSKK